MRDSLALAHTRTPMSTGQYLTTMAMTNLKDARKGSCADTAAYITYQPNESGVHNAHHYFDPTPQYVSFNLRWILASYTIHDTSHPYYNSVARTWASDERILTRNIRICFGTIRKMLRGPGQSTHCLSRTRFNTRTSYEHILSRSIRMCDHSK